MSDQSPSDTSSSQDPGSENPNAFDMDQLPTGSYTEKTHKKENSLGERGYKMALSVGGIVVGVAVMFGLKFYNKGADSEQIKAEMVEVLADFPDQVLIRKLVDRHHDRCFEESYRMGGRRSSSKFDDEKYVKLMMKAIEADLQQESSSLSEISDDQIPTTEAIQWKEDPLRAERKKALQAADDMK